MNEMCVGSLKWNTDKSTNDSHVQEKGGTEIQK